MKFKKFRETWFLKYVPSGKKIRAQKLWKFQEICGFDGYARRSLQWILFCIPADDIKFQFYLIALTLIVISKSNTSPKHQQKLKNMQTITFKKTCDYFRIYLINYFLYVGKGDTTDYCIISNRRFE